MIMMIIIVGVDGMLMYKKYEMVDSERIIIIVLDSRIGFWFYWFIMYYGGIVDSRYVILLNLVIRIVL